MANTFEDGSMSEAYTKYRPVVPKEYEDVILKYVYEKISAPLKTAVDIGCGTGQSTLLWSPHFKHVVGLDSSSTQVAEAKKWAESFKNVEYRVSTAECLSVESGTVQLLNATTCIHWFDLDKFFSEAKRVLVPNGVLAVSKCMLPLLGTNDSPKPDQKLTDHFQQFVNMLQEPYEYLPVQMAFSRYEGVHLPLNDTQRIDGIWYITKSCVAAIRGQILSWSIYTRIVRDRGNEYGQEILSQFINKLMELCGSTKSEEETSLDLHYEYVILLGRKGEHD